MSEQQVGEATDRLMMDGILDEIYEHGHAEGHGEWREPRDAGDDAEYIVRVVLKLLPKAGES